jgi:hypothetical protein
MNVPRRGVFPITRGSAAVPHLTVRKGERERLDQHRLTHGSGDLYIALISAKLMNSKIGELFLSL